MNIYDRLLFKRLTKNFLAMLLLLLFLFFIFDYTLTKSHRTYPLPLHYGAVFSAHGDFLIAIAFTLALLRTLLYANVHFELSSLQIAGASLLKITRTTFLFGLLLLGVNLLNFELLYPQARAITEKPLSSVAIQQLLLPDNSELFYNGSLSSPELLRDLFWIRSREEIWHIHSLQTFFPYKATGIDRFRYQEGKLEHVSKSEVGVVDISSATLLPNVRVYDHLSLSSLYSLLPRETDRIHVHLCYKWVMSLFPLLISLMIFPLAAHYYKAVPSIKIYIISLFVFILLYFIIRSSAVLAESELLSPFMILGLPLALLVIVWYGRKGLSSLYTS